jgi:tetratricopeptide (TPR) repeat protein
MQILQLLWKIIRVYINYRKNLKAIQSGKDDPKSQAAMMKAYMKGDYETAFFRAVDPFFKGYLLMELGQFGAAQPLIECAIQNANDPRSRALGNIVLGQVFTEDQQDDRALDCFRAAQALWPDRGTADRAIAELRLRRGGNSAEALLAARRGFEKEKAGEGLSVDSKNTSLCEHLGTLAWAVAVESQDAAEVDRLVAETAGLTGANPANSTALMHLHFGHAYAALGQAEKSARHFEEAIRVDPNGLSGRAAASMAVPASR